MAEIKRPNYFTGQFLLEGDFKDEQAYHLDMRRRLNRGLHTPGVAEGFELTYVNEAEVQVGPGIAIDKDGREIVLEEAQIYRLTSFGSRNALVVLTVKYQEEPVDRYNHGGIDKFKRTAERPVLEDRTEQPPLDGSVIWLGAIWLNMAGVIESSGSIHPGRLFAGAKLASESVGEAHLADGAVTLRTLAHEALPWTTQGTNAITVTPNDAQRTVTVGETHSARTDNPHATTAYQIDTQGGTNRIVAQINAGTGIIARSRVETSMVTGVVTFTNLREYSQLSPEIDPGLGGGPVCVQLGVDEGDMTVAGDYDNGRTLRYFAKVNRTSGRFQIFVSRMPGTPTGEARVRWYAFKPTLGTDSSVSVRVDVSPSAINMTANSTQAFTANVSNTTHVGATFDIVDASGNTIVNGGSLSTNTGLATTYTSPAVSGTYYLKVRSQADHTQSALATINVTGQIAVNVSPNRKDLTPGGQVSISATVINTGNGGVNWSVQPGNGSVSSPSGASTTYTAPATPGTYLVTARSAADSNKSAACTITVHAVSLSVVPDTTTLAAGGSTTLRATISPAFADQGVTWTKTGPGSLSGQGLTATYTGPTSTSNSTVTIRATRAADSTQFREVTLTVNGTGGGGGSDPDPIPNPGGGKFAAGPVENVTPPGPMPPEETELSALAPESVATARTFVRPQKRPKGKSSKRDDE